tara:strand:- start:458 stop:706 length:249 start_codon:yes stop_codon:yes gene_type:complete
VLLIYLLNLVLLQERFLNHLPLPIVLQYFLHQLLQYWLFLLLLLLHLDLQNLLHHHQLPLILRIHLGLLLHLLLQRKLLLFL